MSRHVALTRLLAVAAVAALAAQAGCSSDEAMPREQARLASLAFDVPADWARSDSSRRGVATAEWQPADNDRKEAITVIRTELSPAVAKAGAVELDAYLAASQRALPQARVGRSQPVVTPRGLAGRRIDVDFIPSGQHDRYRRIHVVLTDGDALVHVLYTAKHLEPALTALDLVLSNLRHEGA
jgi:hypothetical protein